MPLVIMCGIPGSGKTTRALALKAALEQRHGSKVVLVNEESLGLKKEVAYAGTSITTKIRTRKRSPGASSSSKPRRISQQRPWSFWTR